MDRKALKVLAVDTRIDILKLLTERRMMGAEIAARLSLSPSTIFEHMQKLEAAQLVRRVETGHKWVYYQLTEEAESLVQPSSQRAQPIAILLSIAAGLILTGYSTLSFFLKGSISNLSSGFGDTLQSTTAKSVAETLAPPTILVQDALLGVLLAAGVFLLMVGLAFFMKRKSGIQTSEIPETTKGH